MYKLLIKDWSQPIYARMGYVMTRLHIIPLLCFMLIPHFHNRKSYQGLTTSEDQELF